MSKHCVITEEEATACLGTLDRISERTGCFIWISWRIHAEEGMEPQESRMTLFPFFFKSQSSTFFKKPDHLILRFQLDSFAGSVFFGIGLQMNKVY